MSTGAPIVLRSGRMEVELLPEVGGRLHRLRVDGHDLLRTPPRFDAHRSDPFFWGAYPMAPWCNRASPGRRRVADRLVDLAPNFEDGSAIHGLVAAVPWQRRGTASLGLEVDAGRWPWAFEVGLDVELDPVALRLRYRLTNRSDGAMPAGLGLHPWFRAPVEVRLPGRAVYRSNADSSATPEPADGRFDLSSLAPPSAGIDATWTALSEPAFELAWPDSGLRARMTVGSSAPAVLVALATPADTGALAVEPQTHGPDALRRLERGEPDGPILLSPGAALTLDLRLEVVLARNVR